MANHTSAEKRARQAIKRNARNASVKSSVHTAEKAVRGALTDPKNVGELLRSAFSTIQKARGVIHRNAVKRKMARLSKAVARAASGA
jgi:small subunit ribosomal protein S20